MDNDLMMVMRIQRQKTLQEILQISGRKNLLLDDHFEHRSPEITVRVAGALHHRECILHLPVQRQNTHVGAPFIIPAPAPGPGGIRGEAFRGEKGVGFVVFVTAIPPVSTKVGVFGA